MKNFKNLLVWKKGIEITKAAYSLANKLPKEEKYRIVDQLTRAALSIPLNIAEGSSRKSIKEFKHYMSISLGSANEVETILIVLEEIEMASPSALVLLKQQITEEQKMLSALIKN
ncbi:MAG: four helix bundle protein [Parvicellaceae bacterium]|jgi:four helix bundle protein